MYVCVYVCMCVYECMYVCMCVCMYVTCTSQSSPYTMWAPGNWSVTKLVSNCPCTTVSVSAGIFQMARYIWEVFYFLPCKSGPCNFFVDLCELKNLTGSFQVTRITVQVNAGLKEQDLISVTSVSSDDWAPWLTVFMVIFGISTACLVIEIPA